VILFSFAIYNFYLFLITNIFFGISLSLTLPYVESLAIEKLKENYGKSRLFGSIGFMILVLILGEFLTSEMVAIWFLLISVGATLLFGFTIEYEIVKEKLHIEQFSIKGRLKFWISLFLMQFSFGAFYNFFVIYASERAISITMSSYLWTFSVVCEILMFTFQAPIFKRFKTLDIIKFTIIITSFRWFLFFMFDSNLYIYLFAQFLHIFSFALYHSAVITYLHKIYSNKRLAQQFFYGISYGLGGFLGAIFAGVVYGEYLFLYSSLIAMLGFIVILKEDRES
jgi:PPP family 3-phenylpropionic acid transporter